MERLYDLLSDLLEIEHQQSSLLYVLDILDNEYQKTKEDKASLLLCFCKICLLTTKQCTKDSIHTLDDTLLELKNPPDSR